MCIRVIADAATMHFRKALRSNREPYPCTLRSRSPKHVKAFKAIQAIEGIWDYDASYACYAMYAIVCDIIGCNTPSSDRSSYSCPAQSMACMGRCLRHTIRAPVEVWHTAYMALRTQFLHFSWSCRLLTPLKLKCFEIARTL
jgi:hypothetical protein